MKLEIMAIIMIIILYYLFNMNEDEFISITMPLEKMKNVSIFDGNE